MPYHGTSSESSDEVLSIFRHDNMRKIINAGPVQRLPFVIQ